MKYIDKHSNAAEPEESELTQLVLAWPVLAFLFSTQTYFPQLEISIPFKCFHTLKLFLNVHIRW